MILVIDREVSASSLVSHQITKFEIKKGIDKIVYRILTDVITILYKKELMLVLILKASFILMGYA